MVPAGIGGGVLQPSINSMLTKRVGADERGGILGISAALVSGANALAPLMGGILFQVNSGLPFMVWGALLALLFGLAWMLLKPETSQAGGVGQAAPTAE